ncbi:heavy metal translocating P-type ATPase [Pseudothermotoga thermarum DSM 5069]|uniref:Heavy metal translocating P-type ATPase n=1 Tax=Pseudothermotoga thermarum DSM 5069 TaxID=688269 RepID=F7YU73_9THEM|nr:heavy metal translocating P-type ATPase [Pseudothermotoga thermarum DSM 5069]
MEKKSITFKVLGMTCVNCANIVEKALRQIPKVKFAAVNLSTSTAFIVSEEDIPFDVIRTTVESVGYEAVLDYNSSEEEKRYLQAKKYLILSWILTLPLLILMIIHMFSYDHFWHRYLLVFEVSVSAAIVFLIGRKVFKSAVIAITHKHTNMDSLIAIGSTAAWLTGFLKLFDLKIESFASIGAMIMTFHLTGKFIESRLRDKALKQVQSLLKLKAKQAIVLNDNEEIIMPIEAVKENYIVLVKPGDLIPVDGVVVEGQSWVDQSLINGEPIPVFKKENDEVVSGTVNLSGVLKVRATKVGKDSFLEQILQLVQLAQGSKIPIQATVDKITNAFVPFVLVLSVFSFVFWLFAFDKLKPFLINLSQVIPWMVHIENALNFAIFAAISTLLIACPCALGLATPMALLIGTTVAAKKGILVKNAEAVQTSKDVKVVLFDKTGTLTEGKLLVLKHNLSSEDLLAVASIERFSNHPIAKAISSLVENYVEVFDFVEVPSKGVYGVVNGSRYFIGKPVDEYDFKNQLEIVVEVRKNDEKIGIIVLGDRIRKDARTAIEKLKELGMRTVLVSGDKKENVEYVAKLVGIEDFYAEVKPDEKLSIVRNYQTKFGKVAMVGDGINDAASVKGADVGIALATGTDITITSADVIIMRENLQNIPEFIKMSKKMFSTIKWNLIWAFGYNILALPIAAMGLLHPLVAELAMIASSITVTVNSLALQRRI